MNKSKYQWILYVIVVVIICTIGIQIYWNYKNYQTNKQQLINDVQVSLDNAVNDYYANLAERSTLGFAIRSTSPEEYFYNHRSLDTILERMEFATRGSTRLDTLEVDFYDGLHVFQSDAPDSIMRNLRINVHDSLLHDGRIVIRDFDSIPSDSVSIDNFRELTSQVIISMTQDSLNIKKLDSMVRVELDRKNIDVDFALMYSVNLGRVPYDYRNIKQGRVFDSITNKSVLRTTSNSSFLPPSSTLSIQFTNETRVILTRILSGILISTLLVLAVISCLFYLLRIIQHQKELAEVKNDLISNITHEFKTPIATIGVALESIRSFNALDDKEKTKTYIDMSNTQLKKLNIMVEKLLETATLDSENLDLNKESVDLNELFERLLSKYRIVQMDKELTFNPSETIHHINVDRFHFENAVSNIIDNAIKYGGDNISIDLVSSKNILTIKISDSGTSLNKAQVERIFDKFYRVPKGNTHDVKGFGIGLYYSKTVIEKHGGKITVGLDPERTTFNVSIPL